MRNLMKSGKATISIVLVILMAFLLPVQVFAETLPEREDTEIVTFDSLNEANDSANIVTELIDLRDEYTKQFRMDDGTIMAVTYNCPVHYKNSKGKWLEYDNTLVAENEATADEAVPKSYINKKSDTNIELSANTDTDDLVNINSPKGNISWKYESVNKSDAKIKNSKGKHKGNEKFTSIDKLSAQANYNNIYDNIDINCIVSTTGVKENIILKNPDAQNEFVIDYNIKGLKAKQTGEKSIKLYKGKKLVYTITAPYMYDSEGNESTELSFDILSNKGNHLRVKLIADKDFLNSFGRVYPVTIDPEVTVDNSATVDLYTKKSNNVSSYGPYYIDNETDCIVQMNQFPSLKESDRIVKAELTLGTTNNSNLFTNNISPINVELYGVSKNNDNIEYGTTVLDYVNLTSNAYESLTFDITKIAREYDGGSFNPAIYLSTEDTRTVTINPYSHNSTEVKPSYTVFYKNFIGTEPNLSYSTVPVGQNAESSISYYTGSLNIKQNIYEGTGSRMPAHIRATYNSFLHNKLFANGSPAGYGWQFSFNQYVQEADNSLKSAGYDYIYTDEDGTEHYFKEDISEGSEQWHDEDNLGLTLTTDENYVYISNGDVVQKYDSTTNKGVLLSETDSNNNVITYTYNALGNLTKITDGSGRDTKINYAYYSGNSEPRVNSIDLPDGNIIKFAYYSNQLLACVTMPDEKQTWFNYTEYTPNGFINKVDQRDASNSNTVYGMKYNYTYNSNNQVTSIKEYGSNNTSGNYLNFQYNNDNTTKVTDKNRLSQTYTFDNYGNTISILNANGYIENTQNSEGSGLSVFGGSESYTRNYVEESREPSSQYYSKVNGSTSAGGQLTYDTSTEAINGEKVQYLGSKSIRINNTGSSQFYTMAKHQYDDSDLFGKTLTFSSYVKTNNVSAVENAEGVIGAFIKIECIDNNNNVIEESSPGIIGSNGWQRISVTKTIPTDTDHFIIYCGIKDAQGTAWFDCLQLEEGNVMNDYNALQNSDFSTNNAWSNASANNIKQIEGDGTSDRFVYQYVNINKSNVSFNISGQAKANSVPLNNDNKTFGIALKIYYENDSANSNIETHYIPFNYATTAYHSIGATITPDKPNKSIETVAFAFVYQYNENIMYLKNAMLNISNTAYDPYAIEDDNNTSSTNKDELDTEITYPYDGSVSTYDTHRNVITTKQGSVIKNINDEEVIDTSKPYISTSCTYDSTNNYVTSEIDARGNTISYQTNTSNGNVTKVTDGKDNETNYSYDSVGNLTSITGGSTSNTYTYNSANQLSTISHNGFSYNFNYDVYNKFVSTVIGNTTIVTNTYKSNNGHLEMTKYGNNQGLIYDYDDYDRITSITSIVDGPMVSYIYNKKGLVTKAIERKSGRTTEFQYDCDGVLLRKNTTSNDGNAIVYSSGYDSSGNPIETVNLNGQLRTITNGTDDQDNSFIDNGDSKITAFADSLGRTESINLVDNTTNKSFETSYQYLSGAESGSTTELVSQYTQSYDGTTLSNYEYTYDANGNITEIKDNNTLILRYTYDALNQLKEEYNYSRNYYVNYSYDNKGNILSAERQTLDQTSENPTGTITSNVYEYNDNVWKDKLTKFNGDTITYDAIGNPISYRNGMTMQWQTGRELASVTLSDNTSISYVYDTNGLRTSKNVGGTKTHYYYDDNNNLVGLTKGSTTMFFYYDSENSPVSMSYNGTMYYYVKNLQGDIVKIINKNGAIYGTYTYDAWGNIIASTGDLFVSRLNPLRYRGYVYDTETSLYYLQSRYYDPITGRFLNADIYCDTQTGTPLSTNMFAYCENNPVNSIDEFGEWWHTLASYKKYYLNSVANIYERTKAHYRKNKELFGNYISYIFGQSNEPVKDLIMGSGCKISTSGCGLVAIYNVMLTVRKRKTLPKIILEAELNHIFDLDGYCGVKCEGITKFLKHHNVKYKIFDQFDDYYENKSKYKISIIYLTNDNNITRHYFCILKLNNGTYVTLNRYNNHSYPKPIKFLENEKNDLRNHIIRIISIK